MFFHANVTIVFWGCFKNVIRSYIHPINPIRSNYAPQPAKNAIMGGMTDESGYAGKAKNVPNLGKVGVKGWCVIAISLRTCKN